MIKEINKAASLLGKKGGQKTLKMYGLTHYSKMGKKGGRPKKLSTFDPIVKEIKQA